MRMVAKHGSCGSVVAVWGSKMCAEIKAVFLSHLILTYKMHLCIKIHQCKLRAQYKWCV